jgi:hypothetical protein
LEKASFPDNWEEPEEIADFEDDEESLDPIEFPDLFTTVETEQPAIIGDEDA